MSSYNTPAQFLLRAFPSGSFNDIPSGSIQLALDTAAEDINAALRPHHTLPLSSTPANVLEAEVVIASYRLMLYNGFNPSGGEALRTRYEEVTGEKGWLYQLSQGQLILARDVDATPTTNEGAPAVLSSAGRRSRGMRTFDDDGEEYI